MEITWIDEGLMSKLLGALFGLFSSLKIMIYPYNKKINKKLNHWIIMIVLWIEEQLSMIYYYLQYFSLYPYRMKKNKDKSS